MSSTFKTKLIIVAALVAAFFSIAPASTPQ